MAATRKRYRVLSVASGSADCRTTGKLSIFNCCSHDTSCGVRYDDRQTTRFHPKKEKTAMKKLMTLMLGLILVTGTAATTFAQENRSDQTGKKKIKGKKGSKK